MDLLPEFDKNAAYIWASYAIAALILSLLSVLIGLKARRVSKLKKSIDAATPAISDKPRPPAGTSS